ncbi:MAG: MFS transporter [Beijerinckiaceae bacterium]
MTFSPSGTSRLGASLASFAYRDFRYWSAWRFSFGLAYQMKNVAIGWYIYDLTGSALLLGIAGLVTFLPSVVLALFTGYIVDTYDRKLITGLSTGLTALAMAAILAGLLTGGAPVWLIYVATFLTGIGRAFSGPASQAITPNLVPREHFANAVTWISSAWQVSTIVGPAVGGILYGGLFFTGGPVVAFSATLVVSLIAVACAMALRTDLKPKTEGRGPVTLATLTAGLTFMWARPVIFGAVALDLVAVLFGGVAGLLPIIAKDVLQIGPQGLGLLRSAPAVGAIVMAALIAWYPIQSKAGAKMLAAVAFYGLLIVVFGLSKNLWLSLTALAFMGAADMISVVVRHTMVQSDTPDEMRGRVSAVNSIFIGASSDLGDFRSGTMAAAFGAIPAIVFGGAMTLTLAVAWRWFFPALAKRDRLVE